MTPCIRSGMDLHDATRALETAMDKGPSKRMTFENAAKGRRRMEAHLRRLAEEAGGAVPDVQARKMKNQIQSLLKRNGRRKPSGMAWAWSVPHRKWLESLTVAAKLAEGLRLTLASLRRQMALWEREVERLDEALSRLSQAPGMRIPARR
jgi:hypothetical protein